MTTKGLVGPMTTVDSSTWVAFYFPRQIIKLKGGRTRHPIFYWLCCSCIQPTNIQRLFTRVITQIFVSNSRPTRKGWAAKKKGGFHYGISHSICVLALLNEHLHGKDSAYFIVIFSFFVIFGCAREGRKKYDDGLDGINQATIFFLFFFPRYCC